MIMQEELRPLSHRIYRGVLAAVLLIPATVYFWAFLRYSIDMPAGDDYDVILNWLHRFIQSQGFASKVGLLLEAHNEHRIVLDHFVVMINYLMLGRINFIYLDAVGLLGLLLILALLIKVARQSGLSIVQLIPISFLCFNMRQWELISFPMASIQQYWQLLFALLSLYTLQKRGDRGLFFPASIALAILASLTGAGGLIVFPVGLLLLVFSKDMKAGSIWLGFLLAVFLAYFVVLEYRGSPISHASHEMVLKHPGEAIRYTLAFLASYVRTSGMAIALGALTATLCFFMCIGADRSKSARSSLIPLSFIIYIISVAAAAGLSRVSMGIDEALSSRYTIYSLALVASIYIHLMNKASTASRQHLLLCVSLAASLTIYICYLPSSIAFLNYEQKLLDRYMVYPYNGRAAEILGNAMRDKVFMPNAVVFSNLSDEAKAGITYKYPVPYSPDRSIPPPEAIGTLITSKSDYAASWERLSELYFANMDLKLAFPLDSIPSYIDFLTWAANADRLPQADRAIYLDLASTLAKAQPSKL